MERRRPCAGLTLHRSAGAVLALDVAGLFCFPASLGLGDRTLFRSIESGPKHSLLTASERLLVQEIFTYQSRSPSPALIPPSSPSMDFRSSIALTTMSAVGFQSVHQSGESRRSPPWGLVSASARLSAYLSWPRVAAWGWYRCCSPLRYHTLRGRQQDWIGQRRRPGGSCHTG